MPVLAARQVSTHTPVPRASEGAKRLREHLARTQDPLDGPPLVFFGSLSWGKAERALAWKQFDAFAQSREPPYRQAASQLLNQDHDTIRRAAIAILQDDEVRSADLRHDYLEGAVVPEVLSEMAVERRVAASNGMLEGKTITEESVRRYIDRLDDLQKQAAQQWLTRFTDLNNQTSDIVVGRLAGELGINTTEVFDPHLIPAMGRRANLLAGNVSSATFNSIKDVTLRGLVDGASTQGIAREIDRVFGQGLYRTINGTRYQILDSAQRALLIARTETTAVTNLASLTGIKASKLKKWKQWLSQGDDRVREAHLAEEAESMPDGFPPGEAFPITGLEYPSEPNCRCTLIYVDPPKDAKEKRTASGPRFDHDPRLRSGNLRSGNQVIDALERELPSTNVHDVLEQLEHLGSRLDVDTEDLMALAGDWKPLRREIVRKVAPLARDSRYRTELSRAGVAFRDQVAVAGASPDAATGGWAAYRKVIARRLGEEVAEEVEESARGIAMQEMVATWNRTSGDGSRSILAFQRAAIDEFELDDAVTGHFGSGLGADPSAGAAWPAAADLYEKHKGVMRAMLRAQYEATQEYIEKQGLEYVTVYRGMNARANADWIPERGIPRSGSVDLQPMSSYSTDVGVARNFASGNGGVVLIQRIPVENVIGIPGHGMGMLSEAEFVVAGGRYETLMIHVDDFSDLVESRLAERNYILDSADELDFLIGG